MRAIPLYPGRRGRKEVKQQRSSYQDSLCQNEEADTPFFYRSLPSCTSQFPLPPPVPFLPSAITSNTPTKSFP